MMANLPGWTSCNSNRSRLERNLYDSVSRFVWQSNLQIKQVFPLCNIPSTFSYIFWIAFPSRPGLTETQDSEYSMLRYGTWLVSYLLSMFVTYCKWKNTRTHTHTHTLTHESRNLFFSLWTKPVANLETSKWNTGPSYPNSFVHPC